ncbi:MAG TPA: nitroreductase [Micromonosporaceae bacterium]|nr:nitroreductase [Micromonosporaceae bacterium]
MHTDTTLDRDDATRALVAATEVAGRAPSIHNTQPWRWRIHDSVADLYADERRHLAVADPQRRLLVLSCGLALHHACVALAATGYAARVDRMPYGADPEHLGRLASVAVDGRVPVTAEVMRHMQTIRVRHTDRRPLTVAPVPAEAIAAVRAAVTAHHVGFHVLDRDAVLDLAAATDNAQRDAVDDAAARAELDAWSGSGRAPGVGVPDSVIPVRPTLTTVPSRDFGHPGALDVTDEHDQAAVYAVLYALGDEPLDWLCGGEALSAAWLAATEHNIALLPMSAAVEEVAARRTLRLILRGVGYPLIAVRLGIADQHAPAPPATPRLAHREIVEVTENMPAAAANRSSRPEAATADLRPGPFGTLGPDR